MSAPVNMAQQPRQYPQSYILNPYVLPVQYRKASFGISITMIVLGVVTMIIGGISFGFYGYWRYLSIITGLDLWVGLGYLLAGIFGVVVHTNQSNPHLNSATIQYRGGQQQMIAIQPNQPVMVMQPTQPMYVPQNPVGQYSVMPPQTVINSPQTVQVAQPAQPIRYQQVQQYPNLQPYQPPQVLQQSQPPSQPHIQQVQQASQPNPQSTQQQVQSSLQNAPGQTQPSMPQSETSSTRQQQQHTNVEEDKEALIKIS
ncbi:uncharacterized protein TRIADDRAFT_64326 [Trichoplax adhaerens]|uniref:Uncharacterized protein n=1 Tax=Trichoplax adhaerens TaxID=10228 RepID=B3SA69_TRIAD|nr:predicted protein [Trichoplax adhaerens]EDV20385.1 predicted protein [Trichoplax adhaerens]|eukprot:XP_002117079.1 predicted protein [Trichoplax adhaerens]